MASIQAHFKSRVKRALAPVADNSDMTLGERIKKRRNELRLSVTTVAKAAGVSVQAVYQWEKGDTNKLKATSLVGLIEILKVTPRWLVYGTSPKEQVPAKITEDEWRIVKAYRSAPDAVKKVMQASATPYAEQDDPAAKPAS